MFIRKQFKGIVLFTLFIFICFTLSFDYSYGEEESPLVKAQGLYRQGNFSEAVNVLEAFIEKVKDNQSDQKRLAEAFYLLARIYFDSGEEARMEDFLKRAIEADIEIGRRETNLDFKARLDLVRKEWIKSEAEKKEIEKVATSQLRTQEKEKPISKIHKKRKFPWVLAILGIGIVVVLIVLLGKKKTNTQTMPQLTTTYSYGILNVYGVQYELKTIQAAEFQMGSVHEKPIHNVRITRDFWLGKTEVTQGLWQAVMESNPSYFKKGNDYPVEQVSWDDCQAFIANLNQRLKKNCFRLPTEAEWEYACRAGTTGDYYGDIDSIAWFENNSGGTTHPVGQKLANNWGLYDMLGNVFEWCQDWYGENYYSQSPYEDPTGPLTGASRVLRGGCWLFNAFNERSSHRVPYDPSSRSNVVGFRLAASSSGGSQ